MEALNPVEARVLGSLVEKDLTTPDYYPLSLNALTNACNQSSNRDPVVAFSEEAVVRGLDSLREKRLAFVFQGADSRVSRYGHRVVETLGLERPAVAVLCVLLLRGPQTLGEVRARAARMHEFPGLEDAEACLTALASRAGEPLVAKLPRMAGMKEQRYAHLLSGPVALEPAAAAVAPEAAVVAVRFENERLERLEAESLALRAEVAALRRELSDLRKLLE
jgi:uncharacterized protein YceH (UPF0502 family)